MKQGEAGSTVEASVVVVTDRGGRMERPFMLRGRRGAGEVMGRLSTGASPTGSTDMLFVTGMVPNVVLG